MAIAVVVLLLVIGSILFHFLSPWWFTPLASNWGTIDNTILITFWVTGVVFIAVNLFLAWCVLKYRHKGTHKAHYEPENKKLESWLTGITAVGVAAMLAPGLFVWAQFVTVPENAMVFEAVGQQWHWTYRFPGKDGELGDVDQALISIDNPFGMDPDDPLGQDDVLIANPEVTIPINQPVKVLLRSKDVLHDFAVAQFRVKMDLVPGMISYLWFEPTVEGRYEILCEELCGMAHHTMRGAIVVSSQAEFDAWLDDQPTFAEVSGRAPGNATVGQALYGPCAACHGRQGEGIQALNAPKLAGLDGWYIKRQLQNYKNGLRGTDPSYVPDQQMRSMTATLADEAAIDNVVAYIETLPDQPAAITVTGDVQRGEQIYATCRNCHGSSGQGIWAMNAPRQSGMNDWYLVGQLRNFRDGIRGVHLQDYYGRQMAQMSKFLSDDQSINDLVAYINTLGTVELASAGGTEAL